MTPFPPTPEQSAILSFVASSHDNLIVSALAGAAKTSTLVRIAEALAGTSMLFLAFNKRIQVEMKERLPSTCEVKTLNGLGHGVWKDYLGKHLKLNDDKIYQLLRDYIDRAQDLDLQAALRENLNTLKKAIQFGKTCGWVPNAHDKAQSSLRLMDDDEFFAHCEDEFEDYERAAIITVSLRSIELGFKGEIDFADQLLLPTVFRASFPVFRVIGVDEAQDLSALNHLMLRRLIKAPDKQRIIAVGDRCQSIYGFRGAHEESMDLLAQDFNMTEFPLTVCFRCPQSVVEEARSRAPAMQWAPTAELGSVSKLSPWSAHDLPTSATVICRNNAPLFATAIRLLKAGRYPELIGNDIAAGLVKVMEKLGKPEISQEAALIALAAWQEKTEAKTKNKASVRDRADCIRIFLRQGETLGGGIAAAKKVFSSTGPIKLMTGHKSKGLEFKDVFFLDDDLIDLKHQQERNLRYVIQTRAQRSLTYIYSAEYLEGEEA